MRRAAWFLSLGVAAAGLLAGSPAGAAAQDTVVVGQPRLEPGAPAELRALAVFNHPATRRVFGTDTIGPNDVVTGAVGVYRATLRIEGTVLGDVVGINADVILAPGAEVRGDVLIFGGLLDESVNAQVFGTIERHSRRLAARRVGDQLDLDEPIRLRTRTIERDRRLRRTYRRADASLVFRVDPAYNRVEGLPLAFGPRIRWTGPTVDFRVEAVAIFRTAAGFSTENRELGYAITPVFGIGRDARSGRLELEGRFYDLVTPVEDWQLSDAEVGAAAFFLHRDWRDWYLERGAAGAVRLEATRDLTLAAGIRRFEVTSVAERDPWTLFRNGEPWRPNPVVDDGDYTEVHARLELDLRHRRWDGTDVYLAAEWLHGVADADVSPRALPLAVRDPIPADWSYDRVFGDLRLYHAAGLGGLMLRAVGATALGGGPLPLQRRFSLGGPDPLPGYGFRRFACNAAVADPAQPALCDGFLVFQAEYRGGIDFDVFDWDHRAARHATRDATDVDEWWDWDWDGPQFVLFADAGTAWLRRDGPGTLKWDVGAGLAFGGFGVYLARALEADQPMRFLVRLQRRF